MFEKKQKICTNGRGTSRPHATWKWKHMLKKMVIPGDRIAEVESEDTDDRDSVEPYPDIATIGDIGESSDITSPGILSSDSGIPSSGSSIPSSLHTHSYGKCRKTKKDRERFDKGYGVVYLPGYINGLTKKLHLSSAEFFACNTTVRNELVHVLDELLRLKELTRKEYADIPRRLAASL